MNTFKSVAEAQRYAETCGKKIQSIIEIEHVTAGRCFVCVTTNLVGLRLAMSRHPVREIVRAIEEYDLRTGESKTDRDARIKAEVDAEFRAQYAAQIATAIETGKPQVIDHWMETRRAKEGGEWGEYQFSVSLLVRPDGTTYKTAVNCY